MYKDGDFIITNTQTHDSYILPSEKLEILAKKEAICDEDFIEAGIVGSNEDVEWPYAPISRFLLESIQIKENEIEVLKGKEFWIDYLGVCDNALNNLPNIPEIEGEKFDLPLGEKVSGDIYNLLKERRTIREFYHQLITKQDLANILYITFGRFHQGFEDKYLDNKKSVSWRRSSPSAGGLHPVGAYVFIINVEDIKRGIYYYQPKTHQLILVKPIESSVIWEEEIFHTMMGQYFYKNAAVHILSVGDLRIVSQKYAHSRAFTFPYLENGHLIQTAMLIATALGLKNWITAAFCDEYFYKELKLAKQQIPLTWLSLGHGCSESLGPSIHKELEQIGYDRVCMAMASVVKEKVRLK